MNINKQIITIFLFQSKRRLPGRKKFTVTMLIRKIEVEGKVRIIPLEVEVGIPVEVSISLEVEAKVEVEDNMRRN